MERIGFVGLGVMGAPMAHCLLKRGFTVAAHDLRSEAVDRTVTQGASGARDLQDLVDCDAIIVMVNTDAQARHVIETLISLLEDRPRPILSMSTILPSTIRELGAKAAAAGIGLLDAPVSGGPIVAQSGGLAIMVGGDTALFEKARPVFEAMGNAIRHVGPLGAGLTLKLVNNMIAISALPLVGEALHIGLAQGLKLSTMIDVIKASSGNTWLTQEWEQVQHFLEFALRDASQLEALVETGLKDMQLAAALCDEAGIDAPLLAHAIGALQKHGAEGLRSNLEALSRAQRHEQGG
jgi:3-hydroxyisobutyrate dehydrogenase-like beta-hydroxyacid dehydrogenase